MGDVGESVVIVAEVIGVTVIVVVTMVMAVGSYSDCGISDDVFEVMESWGHWTRDCTRTKSE